MVTIVKEEHPLHTNRNIIEHFLEMANRFPDHVAISGKTRITYAQLKQQVIERAAYLRKKGIQKGDRVLVLVPMSVSLYVNVLALFYVGATIVFIDEWVSKKRLEVCCKLAQCKAFIAPRRLHLVAMFFKEIGKIPIWLSERGLLKDQSISLQPVETNDAALITYTTGSTGTPKAAIRTHGILQAQFAALSRKTELSEQDKVMTTLPIVLLIGLGSGSTMVMARFKPAKPWKMSPQKITNQIHANKINVLIASPFFIERLCELNQKQTPLRKIYTGGAPVFPVLANKIVHTFPQTLTQIVFGSTEAEPISTVNVKTLIEHETDLHEKGLLVGAVDAAAEVQIIKITTGKMGMIDTSHWNELLVNTGETGEIIVSGNHVVEKYWGNEEAFAENKIMVSGKLWHRTGDAGRMDAHGNIWLLGRCKQLFTNHNKNISPFIYEAQLASISGVKMGTVLKKNDRVFLVIESEKRAEINTITDCIKKLELVYDEIRMVNSIPRDPRHFSKIDYEKLLQMI